MSGHSHWHTIRHQKAITDAKKGKIFSKISRQIEIAVREKGEDPETNPNLRTAIDHAKSFNMPKDKIERAIKKGSGALEKEKLEEILIEGFGPSKIALIIEGITDNKNRSIGEIKNILNSNNGKIASQGSVRWLFERKGIISINFQKTKLEKPELELMAIESGAEDILWENEILNVYTRPEELEKTRIRLKEKNIEINSAELKWVPKKTIDLNEESKKACQKLFEELDENDSVQEVYSNINEI